MKKTTIIILALVLFGITACSDFQNPLSSGGSQAILSGTSENGSGTSENGSGTSENGSGTSENGSGTSENG